MIAGVSTHAPGPASPREAATVVLARDGQGLEILLLERHARSRMAPGAFAFPGGRVEAADAWPDAARLCRGLTADGAAAVLADVRPPERAAGFWIAALRELFEETGILLAYGPRGTPLSPRDAGPEWAATRRASSRDDATAFRATVVGERLTLATDRMAYYAHWVTPEERAVRFDARFFVTAAFPGAVPDPDGIEVVGARWLAPATALAAHAAGELALPFPTQRILRSMVAHADVAALLEATRTRDIHPVRPRLVVVEGQERILLPGDPGYF